MRKSVLFAIAGAGLLLAGCRNDYIMGDHRYQTIPVDDAPTTGFTAPAPQPIDQPIAAPVDTPKTTAQKIKYAPMTGAVSSGGVDSVSGQKKSTSGKSAVAAGGVYIVQRGDTPERIARKHKVRLSALMAANKLNEASARRLQVGQKLTIPGGKAAVTPAPSKKTDSKKAALENGKYKVQRGDSPERIARRFKVRLKDLLAANNLNEDSARRLQIGQLLTIPGRTSSTTPAPAPAPAPEQKKESAPKPAPAPEQKKEPAPEPAPNQSEADNYVVWEATENTTYAAVAAKYGISEAKLREINTAGATQQIQKGDLIFVPQK